MKQQLWIANSSLLGIFFLSLLIGFALEQTPPKLRIKQNVIADIEKKTAGQAPVNLESIYTNDIFGTFVPQEVRVSKQSFVTPIPEPRAPVAVTAPEPIKQEFIPPLAITLRGLIISSDESKSVAMVADETNVEEIYHLGEKIKDAHLVKIGQNRIVLLRINGQQEVFYLRADPSRIAGGADKWKHIVKAIDDTHFEVDPDSFMAEVDSLGGLLENIPVVGTAYKNGEPLGIRVGAVNENSVGTPLGLHADDLITAVNNIDVIATKSRVDAYEDVITKKIGDTITLSLLRQGQPMTLSYTLKVIKKPKPESAQTDANAQGQQAQPGVPAPGTPGQPGDAANTSRQQMREKRLREFGERHDTGEGKREAIKEIRKRLLDNLRNRLQNRRVR